MQSNSADLDIIRGFIEEGKLSALVEKENLFTGINDAVKALEVLESGRTFGKVSVRL